MWFRNGLAVVGIVLVMVAACSGSDEPEYPDEEEYPAEPVVEEEYAPLVEEVPPVDDSAADPAAAANTLYNRATTVTAVLSNNYGRYEGSYTSGQVSRICGETDPAGFVFPERMYLVEFPVDLLPNASISDFTFHSRELVGGVTETDGFFASVTVITASGGSPPAFVIDAERTNSGQSGSALLSVEDGTATLTVRGTDAAIGWSLDIQAVCHPPQ